MSALVYLILLASVLVGISTLVIRLINRCVNEAIDRHITAALDDTDFDVHVDQALGVVSLPQQRAALDDAPLPRS